MLQTFSLKSWDALPSETESEQALQCIEQGQILFFPELAFALSQDESLFLSPSIADPHAKNVSYQSSCKKLWGVQQLNDHQHLQLKSMLNRFSIYAKKLIDNFLPDYSDHIRMARTSFRPVQISQRKTSFRKDDKRLHVDAFPSAPNQGQRILRVFTNINPQGEDRVWRVGEDFAKVVEHFLPKIKQPLPGSAAVLRALKITKSYRSLYDHYMLGLHDLMKADDDYQKNVAQKEIRFPPGSTWLVQTDQVSHAAMQGQYVLEQTFYLPVTAMRNKEHAPLRILERKLGKPLI